MTGHTRAAYVALKTAESREPEPETTSAKSYAGHNDGKSVFDREEGERERVVYTFAE